MKRKQIVHWLIPSITKTGHEDTLTTLHTGHPQEIVGGYRVFQAARNISALYEH